MTIKMRDITDEDIEKYKLIVLHCILCGRVFYRKPKIKGLMGFRRVRDKNAVTCSPYCSRRYYRISLGDIFK